MVSAVKFIDWVASHLGTYLDLTPGRPKERQVSMKAASRMNNGVMKPHEPCFCQPHEEREPSMPLESCCPRCKGQLELVQPDLNRGDALLGVCANCPAWYLIDGCNGAMIDLGLADRLSSSSLIAMAE